MGQTASSTQHTRRDKEMYSPLMQYVHDNVIGDGVIFDGPYGKRAVVYCDYTASGRPLKCIEEYISKYVYQYYANTHTTTCITAHQTTTFRHEAKEMIKKCVNASEEDVVIFTGSGTTGAIHKLIGVLELKSNAANTVIFISPFEHHSNLLPWKECGAEVVRIREDKNGNLDIEFLEQNLKEYRKQGKRMIASFNAASNITGIITDTVAVAELCHKYGALSFWDYATAAPYLEIDMNASSTGYKDAVFASPHKFVGGPGTPGILIAKRHLFTNAVPHGAGGGTVRYVTKETHVYVDDIESREEGGTPAIVESIRAGLVFQLKQDIGPNLIESREESLYRKAREVWTKLGKMVILGSGHIKRLPIFSFLVRYREDSNKFLHHNFVAMLLNDVFGIQARGGCACAGPYAEGLLGINGREFTVFLEGLHGVKRSNKENADECEDETTCTSCTSGAKDLIEIMKPGFVRLNLPYLMNETEIKFIIDSVTLVTQHGWKLLPQYKFNPSSGEWSHRTHVNTVMHLKDVSFTTKMVLKNHPKEVSHVKFNKKYFEESLQIAHEIFNNAVSVAKLIDLSGDIRMGNLITGDKQKLIWFAEPWQAAADLVLEEVHLNTDALSSSQSARQIFKPRQMTVFVKRQSAMQNFVQSIRRGPSKRSSTLSWDDARTSHASN